MVVLRHGTHACFKIARIITSSIASSDTRPRTQISIYATTLIPNIPTSAPDEAVTLPWHSSSNPARYHRGTTTLTNT